MTWRRNCVAFLFVLLVQSVAQDIRSFMMSEMVGWQFNCASTTCLPFSSLIVSDIFKCELACLAQVQCEAISFHQSTTKCELFANITNQNGNMSANIDVVTMIVIDQTRFASVKVLAAQWNPSGTTMAGNPSGTAGVGASQLNKPYVLRLDSSNALYISELDNNRIQKWIIGNSNGVTVAGQADGTSGSSSTTLNQPVGLAIDSNDNMYIADKYNNRVIYWANGASSGSIIAGT
ncbi:unnamed protein product, partial [Adineta steineri]